MEVILTSVGLGLLATTSPCVLPLYPGFLAYLSGSTPTNSKLRYWLGVFVLLGVLTMMLLLGLLIALLSISVGRALTILIPIADALLIVLGILLLLDKNPFKQLPQIQSPLFAHPLVNAFVYGLLYGPITLPCSGPLVVGIFAYSLTVGEVLSKLSVFLWFGVGFGLPLLVLSLLSGALQRQLTRLFAIHSRKVNLVGGLLLISIALYDLWFNRELLLHFW
jgi:cytochrome c-type biogenesis protein